MTSSEKVFYGDDSVTVTQSRFIAEAKTYAMRNISSVSLRRNRKSRFWQFALVVVGVVLVLADASQMGGWVMVGLGAVWLYFTRDEYAVRISSNSGEADGFVSADRKRVEKIVEALNEAIVTRG